MPRDMNLLYDSLVKIYKSFIRPHLHYADVIFDKPSNATFYNRIESIQYNAALAIIGTIRSTSKEKLYQKLRFETMKERRQFQRLCCFYKILNNKHQLIFTVYFPHQIDILIHVRIPKLERFSPEQKLLVILFCLRQKQNGTNFIPQSVKLFHIQYFTKHFQTLSGRLEIALLESMMVLI